MYPTPPSHGESGCPTLLERASFDGYCTTTMRVGGASPHIGRIAELVDRYGVSDWTGLAYGAMIAGDLAEEAAVPDSLRVVARAQPAHLHIGKVARTAQRFDNIECCNNKGDAEHPCDHLDPDDAGRT